MLLNFASFYEKPSLLMKSPFFKIEFLRKEVTFIGIELNNAIML